MHKTNITHRCPHSWYKITIELPCQYSDRTCAFLSNICESGFEQIAGPLDASPQLETIITYLPIEQEVENHKKSINRFIHKLNEENNIQAKIEAELIIEQDWNSAWKEHFKPHKLTDRIIIKPSWEEYSRVDNEIIIEMDPGMAFGTGLHASTQLALTFIEPLFESLPYPDTVLDVGTGTGILAMSCALLGAKQVIAVDNDLDATTAALVNVRKNGLQDTVTIDECDINTISNQFDLVIANITQDVLCALSEELRRLTAPQGHLILSGILHGEQAENIIQTFSALGFPNYESKRKEEWVAFHFLSSAASL